jgi:hypothetical protein
MAGDFYRSEGQRAPLGAVPLRRSRNLGRSQWLIHFGSVTEPQARSRICKKNTHELQQICFKEPMALIQFVVHRNGEKWCVRSTGLERSFADEAAARAAAVELASHSGRNGKPAIVLVEHPGGVLETIWSYGEGEAPANLAQDPPAQAQ